MRRKGVCLQGVAVLVLAFCLGLALSAQAAKKNEVEVGGNKTAATATPTPAQEDASIAHLKEGFRGVAWGTKKGDVKSLALFDCKEMDPIVENCGAEKGVNRLESVPLTLLRYKFAGGAFSGVTLKFDAKHADMVKGLVTRELGAPNESQDGIPVWKNDVFMAWLSATHFVVNAKKPMEDALAKKK